MKDESRTDASNDSRLGSPARGAAKPVSRIRGSAFFSSVDASLLGLGSQMMSEVVAGVLLGLGLDYVLGTRNRWVVVGSLAGVAVAMVTVIRLAIRPQTPRRQPRGGRPSTTGTLDAPPANEASSSEGSTDRNGSR